MTRIKICGIKNAADGAAAARAGADFIGLVLASSPRQITPEMAREIAAAVKKESQRTQVVGVFVNTPVDDINNIGDYAGLDWVQLSGDEALTDYTRVERPLIKALHLKDSLPYEPVEVGLKGRPLVYLLDAHVAGKYGGTGVVFNWELARDAGVKSPIILAGGLTPGNVAQAIKQVNPWGVDVSTGVETGGVKDMVKVRAFIDAVRRASGTGA